MIERINYKNLDPCVLVGGGGVVLYTYTYNFNFTVNFLPFTSILPHSPPDATCLYTISYSLWSEQDGDKVLDKKVFLLLI